MVSRRNVVHTIAAAGAAALGARVTDVLSAGAQAGPTPVNFAVPAGACDCHVHVFGDPRRFPLSADRPYTPPPAPVAALRRVLNELHMDRVVIVSPAVYGASNECTLDAIRQLGSRARGIALYLAQTSDAELERLRRYGRWTSSILIWARRPNFATNSVASRSGLNVPPHARRSIFAWKGLRDAGRHRLCGKRSARLPIRRPRANAESFCQRPVTRSVFRRRRISVRPCD